MSVTDAFGSVVSADMVEQAVLDTLQELFPQYLRKIERAAGLPFQTLEAPRSYVNRNTFDPSLGQASPRVVVISPGLIGTPSLKGTGDYWATWRVAVGIAIAETTESQANSYVKAYAAAARLLLLQNGGLGGIARGVTWLDETYPDLPIRGQLQQYRAAGVFFAVDVQNVANWKLGPIAGEQDYGLAQTVDVNLVKTPIEDEV